ncbi:40064_t:CDS:2, partial [Gigaspora margarita]
MDESFKTTLISNIISEKNIITEQEMRLKKLKQHAQAQAKLESKKAKMLEKGIVEKYNGPERPSAAMIHSDFWDKIHNCIEVGATHQKRKKVVIKVHTIKHLCKALEEKYNLYLFCQCISTYLELCHSNIFAACRYYYPARVALTSVVQTEITPYVDEHYCLVSIKTACILAEVFVDDTIIIFKMIKQNSKMKLIPSVYLVIDPANLNNSLRLGQLVIFVRSEYFVGTILLTHMSDLESIIPNQEFAAAIMKEDKVKPVWVLLVDGEPDENPKHMKNII